MSRGHVAVLAFPCASHPSALYSLACRLAEWTPDVAFTFFCTPKSNCSLSSWAGVPNNLKIYDVAGCLREDHLSNEEDLEMFLGAAPGKYREAVEGVQEKVSCVLSDSFLCFAGHMAEEMGVPWFAFWIGGACSLAAHVNTDLIRSMIGTRSDEVSARLDEYLPFIPGFSQFRVRDLPEGIVFGGPLDSPLFKCLHGMGQELPHATAILINTIEEMDSAPAFAHLRMSINQCLAVGPVTLLAPVQPEFESDPHSCLAWLDSQPPATVAYVSFGTLFMPPPSELAALAEGLEASGVRFLWSLKDKERESLPAGFLERTRWRGLVVPWAPQSRVMGHPATGAFLTHCGWNSTLESIMEGVPMMCRPFFGDQRISAQFSSNLGIAVAVEGGVIRRDDLMDGLNRLLHKEEGRRMREKVSSLKLIAKNAVSETGSSIRNLKTFLKIIKGST